METKFLHSNEALGETMKFTNDIPDHIINITALRNIEIRGFWHGLSYRSRLSQYERLEIVAAKYKLSIDRIKSIVYKNPKDCNNR